jgi:hypothetical protein
MARRMSEAMQCFNSAVSEQPQSYYIVQKYPWDNIANGYGTVVDVGGAQGHVSIELARAYPSLKLVVQDLPAVVAGVEDKLPTDVKDRIKFMGHDFLTDQTVQADAYLFSWIFHDWPDTQCIQILRSLIPSLKPGARVISYDHLLPEPGSASYFRERAARYINSLSELHLTVFTISGYRVTNGNRDMDMIMFSLFNSHEREADDWSALFKAADARFGDVKVWVPEGSKLGIVESVWQEQAV